MIVYENGKYRELSADEVASIEKENRLSEISERLRPYTLEEVLAVLIPQQINTLSVDDHTALRMKEFYPVWTAGTGYEQGFKVRCNDKLWRVRQAHTAQVGWEPENVASLWEQINEIHDGTVDDPIVYDGYMVLEEGKYYYQNEAIYLCVRDTVNPVYHPLSQLIGIYVDEV
jgi:hypothetical protein